MDFKDTLFLPQTNFSMRGQLPLKEPVFINKWSENKLYESIRSKSKGKKKFVLQFGPPYANGHIHIGHALSEVLKDIINKTYQMKGFDAGMIPGWDCHGLPIEWKIEEQYRAKGLNKDDIDPIVFRQECRDFAQKWTDIQKEEFKRLGIIADFDNAYSTMNFKTEAKIVEELGKILMNGSLYRGLKPVLWSVVEKTALAEAEVEYKDHTSDSIMVAFPIIKTNYSLLQNVKAVIWTTTPWTLPANRAISYGEDIDYILVSIERQDNKAETFLIAAERLEYFLAETEFKLISKTNPLKGSLLEGTICHHPWNSKGYDFDVPLLMGRHVTTDAGTGLVHTAPTHGLEDFEVGQKYNLEIPEYVQNDGTYAEHTPLFAGQHIFKVNAKVIEELKSVDALLSSKKLLHSYPHSWRSKSPLIYRTTAQWFISMNINQLRDKALDAINDVNWFPASGKNRISSMVENRPDWCLSRQRAWGTPIAIFVNKATGEPLRDEKVHQRIVDAIAKEGADVWFKNDASYFLAPDYNPEHYEKINDILDVWFDSGCVHAFTIENNPDQAWPADVYLEGSDQHRGWFQASLLESCGTRGIAPYKNVVTHGFVLDKNGYKMSKSLGNTITPGEIIEKYGADLLRLWIVNSDYSEDLRIGDEIMKRQEDIYRRFRNTLRYLLGAVNGYSEAEKVDYQDLPSLEKYILHQCASLDKVHEESINNFDFSTFYSSLHQFCSVDLSSFYFDMRKDVLYCDHASSITRKATRTVMMTILEKLILWLAPVLSFTAEEAFEELQIQQDISDRDSVHTMLFSTADSNWFNPVEFNKWVQIKNIRKVVTSALEIERSAKTIGSSLQAHIDVYVNHETFEFLENVDLNELCIVSSSRLLLANSPANAVTIDDVENVGVVVIPAEGLKCERCWKIYNPSETANDLNICNRCDDAIQKTAQS